MEEVIALAADSSYMPLMSCVLAMLGFHGGFRRVFIVHDGLSNAEQRLATNHVAGDFPIEWISLRERLDPSLVVPAGFTRSAYGRMLLGDLLPRQATSCLYLDCGVLVRKDLGDLCRIDLEGAYAGACVDADRLNLGHGISTWRERNLEPTAAYFNSGVMAIDLAAWRSDDLGARLRQTARTAAPGELTAADQDVLNMVLYRRWKRLPAKWNAQSNLLRRLGAPKLEADARELMSAPDVAEARHDPAIVDFAGGGGQSSWYSEWARFAAMTPFRRQLLGDWPTYARRRAWSIATRPLDLAMGRRSRYPSRLQARHLA